jgi:hypothetical protein
MMNDGLFQAFKWKCFESVMYGVVFFALVCIILLAGVCSSHDLPLLLIWCTATFKSADFFFQLTLH